METGRPRIETGLRQEALVIEPQRIVAANHSPEAEENRAIWEDSRRRGKLKAYYRCSDARLKPVGLDAISLPSIAAANEPSVQLASDRGIEASIVFAHFDGETLKSESGIPEGCGGLKAKKTAHGSAPERGIGRYIEDVVLHEDHIIHSYLSALRIAEKSGKPALAATQDHRNYRIYPIAVFHTNEAGEMVTQSRLPQRMVYEALYHPRSFDLRRIYEDGIPELELSHLPDVFADVIDRNMQETRAVRARYPYLEAMQRVQQPRVVLFTTNIRPARVGHPEITSIPGSTFKVLIPREKMGGQHRIPEEDLQTALSQIEYPITESNRHRGDHTKAFSNTDRVIIETGDFELSQRLAQTLGQERWMRNWLSDSERRIIMLQTNAGVVNQADYFNS
jgi:hypothetical protein